MFNLKGKVALVTGASRGLGWSMAESLARCGAHVALNARDPKALAQRVEQLASQGLSAEACAFDVADLGAGERCIEALAARHGRFDILVANAGINIRKPIGDFTIDDYRQVIEVNQTAVWSLSKSAARQMLG